MDDKMINLEKEVQKEGEKVKAIISEASVGSYGAAKKQTLYSTIVQELSNGTRNTQQQIKYLDVLEQSIAVFRALSRQLRIEMDVLTLEQKLGAQESTLKERKRIDNISQTAEKEIAEDGEGLQRQISDAIFFSNRYALYFAGYAGLAMLNSKKANIEDMFSFGTDYDSSKDQDELSAQLSKMVTQDLLKVLKAKKERTEEAGDEELKYTLEAVFTTWINQFSWSTFKDITERYDVEKTKFVFGNFSILGGTFKQKHNVVLIDDRIMKIPKTDVIGNTEFGEVLWSNLTKLGAYDHEKGKNPYDPAGVIFTFGEPGCGKTFTAHAYMYSFAERCRELGIPIWAFTHSTTDYASHYQNKTANELAALAQRIIEFPGAVVMYVADADSIFQSRKNPNLTTEQQNTLAVYFKMFDGTLVPKNGKFMAIMDANYVDGIDDATKSRIFDEVVELKRFSKAEDFSELARSTLTKGVEDIALSNSDWLEIGEYLLSSPLSNREISHVIKQIRRKFQVPEEMLGKPYEVHLAYRNEQLRKIITKEGVTGQFENYITTRMEIERKSAETKKKDDMARFLEALTKIKKDTK